MARPLEFRAWSKTTKKWVSPGPCVDCAHILEISPLDCREDEVMQFTGLHDKNGKKIWEGDILKWAGLEFPITVDDYHGYRFLYGKDILCRAYARDGEVIGNIYEIP